MTYGSEFLHDKLNYETKEIKTEDDIKEMARSFRISGAKYACYDTETTGLNHMKDTPFMVIFGFNKNVYVCDIHNENFNKFIIVFINLVREFHALLFAHNAKYDRHMLINNGTPIPEDVKLADTITLARLITPCDDDYASMKLADLGEKYVDSTAKFAGDLIKDEIKVINKKRKEMIKTNYEFLTGLKDFGKQWELYDKKINLITRHHEVFDDYKPANYYDVYLSKPELMIKYAFDDVVIMLEFIKKVTPIYANKYTKDGVVNNEVFFRENKLIPYIGDVERNGFKVDVDYLINSHYVVLQFKEEQYKKLHDLTNDTWTIGQHIEIKKFFKRVYNLELLNADKKTIKNLGQSENKDIAEISKLITKLRTVDKWLSTYIDGVLNKIIKVDGEYRLFTTINNNGTVSGRVSSDLQQMPKFPIYRDEKLEVIKQELKDELYKEDSSEHKGRLKDAELFHPRRIVVPSKGTKLVFADYSQVELRVQAYYTILSGDPDYNLCRAYMPYACFNSDTFENFDYTNHVHIQSWNNKQWFNPDGTEWKATDLHSATTIKAFPELDVNSAEFKKARYMGKMTNFSSNYCVGTAKLAEQLDCSMEVSTKLRNGYKETFPGVITYQKNVNSMLHLKGFVENLYGRKYYIDNSNNYYKGGNYLVQGTAADSLKDVEIHVCEYLKDKKSKFIMAIHDELAFEITTDEYYIVSELKEIMERVRDKIPYIPIVCEVEYSDTSWADKKGWK